MSLLHDPDTPKPKVPVEKRQELCAAIYQMEATWQAYLDGLMDRGAHAGCIMEAKSRMLQVRNLALSGIRDQPEGWGESVSRWRESSYQ